MMKKITFIIIIVLNSCLSYGQDINVTKNIFYTPNPVSEQQKLDLYIPNSETPLPCLVWIHGGAWKTGSKDRLGHNVEQLLKHGYVVASINYRLSDEAIFPAQIFDCKAAIRFLKANCKTYNIDSSRIAVAGSSAGGHLVALLGTSADVVTLEDQTMGYSNVSSRVQAVIDYYGPTNFLIMDNFPDGSGCVHPALHCVPNSPESLLLGCNIADCPEKVKMANPISYITPDDPPFLIFHGTSDCTVTALSSIVFEKALKDQNIPVVLHLIQGAEHGGPQFSTPEINDMVLKFLDRNLNKKY